jgi:large subunit ribosomal protein L11
MEGSEKKKIHYINIGVNAQMAEAGPPLGTVLGNLGVNTVKFCKEFNEFTNDVPNYLKLRVQISIMENKSYSFVVREPSVGYIISLSKVERDVYFDNH